MVELIDRNKVSLYELGARSGHDVRAMRVFRKFLLSEQFDIIHCHEHTFFANLALASLNPRPVLIYHEHGGFLLRRNIKTRMTYATFAHFFNAFIALHGEMVSYMVQAAKVCAKRTTIIENAVDIDYFRPSIGPKRCSQGVDTGWTIGAVGRLAPEKDFNLFFDVARLIIKKRKDIRFVVVGDGSVRPELQIRARDPEIQGRIELVGARSDIPNFLRTFDLFLFTSRVEGFGLSVLESLACGVPVVAARPELGAAASVLKALPGVSMVNARDANDLAALCLNLLENPLELENMGRAGREHIVRYYSAEKYVQSVEKLYEKLLVSHKVTGRERRGEPNYRHD
jgi:glycosyltransferase involved in cell wall biosynthesis